MLKPGMFINDRYEIIDKVGSGGMADVYKAKCHRLNRFVAIKVLKPEYSSDKSFVNKFRGEAQSAAGLSHPNIVNVYDVGDDSGLHYIVMELVEGITLKRFIERKGKLEVKEAVGIAVQIAQGMEAAHDNRIIHRDIKPQNIIISRDGKVKVTDFGIAKATNSNTITSNAMGSVHYLSPEQARGGYSDEKSDIYSLGVTIYEMLSGKVPFAGDNTVSVALLHIQGEAMPLRDLDPSIPISIDKIVQKCMQKKPERRYHSASELITDLKRAIANPDGDFVHIPAFVTNDSPTINISDDLGKIKHGAFLGDEVQDGLQEPSDHILGDEDEELDSVDSKVDKIFVIGSIISIVIIAIAIIFIVIRFILPGSKPTNPDPIGNIEVTLTPTPTITPTPEPTVAVGTYKVPDVTGLTFEDARATIIAKDPGANVTQTEDYSDVFEKGLVMLQYPSADKDWLSGDIIILTISSGPKPFELPNLAGLTESRADRKLSDMNLKSVVDYVPSDTVEEGLVIETNPPRESTVFSGDTITVIISTGPLISKITVPNLIGATEEEATRMLTDVGLVKGSVNRQPSNTYEKGKVTYQSNTVGQKVDRGTKIDIIVSSGPEEVQTGGGQNGGGQSGNVSYIGKLIITMNPFEYLDVEEAEIILEMTQGGWTGIIYEGLLKSDSFPLTVTDIDGEGASAGTVKMYVDGIPFRKDDASEVMTWTVNFDTVED